MVVVTYLCVMCQMVFRPRPVSEKRIKSASRGQHIERILPEVPFANCVCGVVATPLQVLRQQSHIRLQTEGSALRKGHVNARVDHVAATHNTCSGGTAYLQTHTTGKSQIFAGISGASEHHCGFDVKRNCKGTHVPAGHGSSSTQNLLLRSRRCLGWLLVAIHALTRR